MFCRYDARIFSTRVKCGFFCLLLFCTDRCHAAEAGLSNYIPGYYGDFAVAVAPKPGVYGYATYYGYFAETKVHGFAGKLELSASALIAGFQYVTAQKIAGITIASGAYSALLDASIDGELTTKATSVNIHQHKSGQGDTSISPMIAYWSIGNFYFNFYEGVFIPTGSYKKGDSLNLSRNYFGFDTVFSFTWLNPASGLEASIVPGILTNTENKSSSYKTGSELHIDWMLNKYIAPDLALGLQGYYYAQFEDDELNGQKLRGARSSSVALGPSLLWIPNLSWLEGKVVFKWLHDLDSDERFKGDILSLTGALKF